MLETTIEVMRALALLTQIGIAQVPSVIVEGGKDAPLVFDQTRHAYVQKVVDGYVVEDGERIHVTRYSAAYKAAAKGDARLLAGVIAHERWHVLHGMEEAPAYAEQLRVLRALDAPTAGVEQAMAVVVKR